MLTIKFVRKQNHMTRSFGFVDRPENLPLYTLQERQTTTRKININATSYTLFIHRINVGATTFYENK